MFRRNNGGDIVAKQVHEPFLQGAGRTALEALQVLKRELAARRKEPKRISLNSQRQNLQANTGRLFRSGSFGTLSQQNSISSVGQITISSSEGLVASSLLGATKLTIVARFSCIVLSTIN